MKRIAFPALYRVKSWSRSFRVLAAFLLGMGLCLLNISKYFAFARAIDSPVQIFESFIVAGSTVPFFIGILLGSLLLLSDAPFLSPLSKYEMLRIGRKKWLFAQVVYIFLACVIYSLAILAFTAVISAISSDVFFSDSWSPAMVMLAEKQPLFAVVTFKLAFGYPEFISAVTPFPALLLTLGFNTLYTVLVGLCMLAVNAFTRRNLGWMAAAVLHIFGYISYANRSYGVPLKYSPLCCAIPAFHYIEGFHMSAYYSFAVLAGLIALLVYICKRFASSLEPFN